MNRTSCLLPAAMVICAFPAALPAGAKRTCPQITDLGGNQYRVVFRYQADAGAETVHLAGTFNGWDPRAQPMDGPDDQGVFAVTLLLPKGRHEYKFVVNGKTWRTDPSNPHKTEGYRNAILHLGAEPAADHRQDGAALQPVEMAGEVEHPEPVKQLIKRLEDAGPTDCERPLAAWFAEHPMPLFTKTSVTFVLAEASAADVWVQIAENGRRSGYGLRRSVPGVPVWAVSLDRSKLPDRMAYTFEVHTHDREKRVIDPHAWSLTSRSGQPAALAIEASDRRGRIEVIADFQPSVPMPRSRDIYVYLPPGYDHRPDKRYPVLYMHDGQNCWDDPTEPFGHGGWCVNLKADELINADEVRPFIAVGIANTPDRMKEYGLGADVLCDANHTYIQFLKREVKPLIDRKYRTLADAKNTALMGSSMGGVISFQAALLNPGVFGQAACLSPAFGFENASNQGYAELARKSGKVAVRLYLDSGTAGRRHDGAAHTRKMAALLREIGWKDGQDLLHFEDIGALHNERAWRSRLDKPFVFLFGR